MQNTSLKLLAAFILFASLAGCASTPPVTSHAMHQMDLEQAFRQRGLYLNENGKLMPLKELCNDWMLSSKEGRKCAAENSNIVFEPTAQPTELMNNPPLAMLVRALPKDADFTALPLQKKLLAEGLYQTWAGETRSYSEPEQIQANQQGKQPQGFITTLPASPDERLERTAPTTIFK